MVVIVLEIIAMKIILVIIGLFALYGLICMLVVFFIPCLLYHFCCFSSQTQILKSSGISL